MKHFFGMFLFFGVVLAWESIGAEKWETLKNCRYMENNANDGDSFHVNTDQGEFIFRLYFVDAPETDERYPDRVAEQGDYFELDAKKTLKIGNEAKDFTSKVLRKPFSVTTRWQDARGDSNLPRFYAFIDTADGSLDEMLVAQGLARVFGENAKLPNGKSASSHEDRLSGIEKSAKAKKMGAWRYNSRIPEPRGLKTAGNLPSIAPPPPQPNPSTRPAKKPLTFEQKEQLEAQRNMGLISEQEYQRRIK